MSEREILLETRNLTKEYPLKNSFGIRGKQVVHAVSGVDLQIFAGETLSLVGESGCGKSVTAKSIVRLREKHAGADDDAAY